MSRTPTAVEIIEILPMADVYDDEYDNNEENNANAAATAPAVTAREESRTTSSAGATTAGADANPNAPAQKARIDLTGAVAVSANVIDDEKEY